MNRQDALRWLCPQRKEFNREGAKVAKLREAERSQGTKAGGMLPFIRPDVLILKREISSGHLYSPGDPVNEQPRLNSLVGQDSLKKALLSQVAEARTRLVPLPHILLCGPPGRGKATIAQAVAREMNALCQFVAANSLRRGADICGILAKLGRGHVLAVLDIDTIQEVVLEFLLPAVQDFKFVVPLMHPRSVTIPIPPFTLIGTTSKRSRVNERLAQWMTSYDLAPYTDDDMQKLLSHLATREGLTLAPDASELLVQYSESSPQTAFALLKRLKTYEYGKGGYLSCDSASAALCGLGYRRNATNSRDLMKTLRAMSGTEFESFVADVFQRSGYASELTPSTGDHGIDIILRKLGRVIVVQCKRWDGAVGEPVLRDFYGAMVAARADSGFVVTTNTFTVQAVDFVKDKPIELYDIDALVGLCLDIGKVPRGSPEDGLFGEETGDASH